MKIKFLAIISTFCLFASVSCNSKKPSKNTTEAVTKNLTVQMKVKGMTCESCAKGIKGTLSQHKSIQDIEVKVKEGLVSFKLAGNSGLSDEQLKALVSDLGFTVEKLEKSELSS